MKRALITGITGQDGSYLAELLLDKGYEVHGIVRRSSLVQHRPHRPPLPRPARAGRQLFLHYGDLTRLGRARDACSTSCSPTRSTTSARRATSASPSTSPSTPRRHRLGTLRLLEAIRDAGVDAALLPGVLVGDVRRRAAAAERGDAVPPAQPVRRRQGRRATGSTVNYREAYGMFAVQRHPLQPRVPAPRRDLRHPQDHPRASPRIKAGLQDKLYLGNLDAKRDWGYAPDYVEAMWRMLQQDEPDDYVIATGETHTVREFLEDGVRARSASTGRTYVEIDPRYFRPAEVDALLRRRAQGAARSSAGSRRSRFKELVRIMVDADVEALEDQLAGRRRRAVRARERRRRRSSGRARPVVVTGGAGFLGRAVVRDARGARRRRARHPLGRARPARPARRARGASTAPRSSSTSPPTSAASASTAATRRRSSTTT